MSGGKDFQTAIVRVLRARGLLPAELSAAEVPDAALAAVNRLATRESEARSALLGAGVVFAAGYPRVLYGGREWRLVWAPDGLWSSVPSKEVGGALAAFLRDCAELRR